tara:strand:+ start:1970 stop:2770 length:801 start_codon:yes stop_codon:yes gene_type:complete
MKQALDNDDLIPTLENFDMQAFRKVLSEKPAEIGRGRYLRILQCVNEVGAPHILESLKLAFTTQERESKAQANETPIVEKLFHIHMYLDNQESQSHILIARNRYIKYCYFETYELAVKALRQEKDRSNREKRKISALKLTTSFKQGLLGDLPAMPHTDRIQQAYKDLSNEEKKKRAPDMVKDEITRKVASVHKDSEKRIRASINRYIREGKVLHYILQGTVCLDPCLLILFPGRESHKPSLDTSSFQDNLQEKEQKRLNKPINLKE